MAEAESPDNPTTIRLNEPNPLRARLHQLRGQYLSDLNEIEGHVDQGIAAYFDLVRSEPFEWVLGALGSADKVRVVTKLSEATGTREYFAPWTRGLNAAIEYRNALAHSYVDMALPEPIRAIGAAEWEYMQTNFANYRLARKGRSQWPALVTELEAEVDRLDALSAMALRFMIAMACARDTSRTVLQAMQDVDAGNPQLPLMT